MRLDLDASQCRWCWKIMELLVADSSYEWPVMFAKFMDLDISL
jgi:hypothetical protein